MTTDQSAWLSRSVDLGRVIGASAIFYFHVGIITDYPCSPYGEYAVGFFIFLSAFTYICFSSNKPIGLRSYGKYVGMRFATIFSVFLVVNCVILLGSYLWPSALGRPFTAMEFVLSSSGLSQYFGYRYLSAVMWFVPVILQAYLLFPVISYCLARYSAALVMFSAFVISLFLTAKVFAVWPLSALEVCRNWSIVFRLPEVCAGVILGGCLCGQIPVRKGGGGLVVFGALALLQISAFTPPSSYFAYMLAQPWRSLVTTASIGAVAMIGAAALASWKTGSALRLLGNASFAFFLVHGVGLGFVSQRVGTGVMVWLGYYLLCWLGAIVLTRIPRSVARAASAWRRRIS